MKYLLTFLISIFLTTAIHGLNNEPIEVADMTLKIGAKEEKELFYAFAAGDKIVFNLKEINDKELKEVEVLEFPDNSKFKDYETKEIKEKTFKVLKNSIFKFRFYNSNLLKGRVCKVQIYRIPQGDQTINFNTGVKWIEKLDTSYEVKTETVIVRNDTIQSQKSRKVLASVDTNVSTVVDRLERVSSTTKINGNNVTIINFNIPETQYDNMFKPYKVTEVVSWAYTIFVGQSGQVWYKNAEQKASAQKATRIAAKAGLVTSGYGALALLAIEGFSAFSNPPAGDNVKYTFIQRVSNGEVPFEQGNSVAASGRQSAKGYLALRLENDNLMDGINVEVKIVSVSVTKTYKDEYYTVQEVEPVKEKQTIKIPKVTVKKVPIIQD